LEIPPGFGRDIERNRPTSVAAWSTARCRFALKQIRGYLQRMHQLYLTFSLPAGPTSDAAVSSSDDRLNEH
jgi:hypothetical protein